MAEMEGARRLLDGMEVTWRLHVVEHYAAPGGQTFEILKIEGVWRLKTRTKGAQRLQTAWLVWRELVGSRLGRRQLAVGA